MSARDKQLLYHLTSLRNLPSIVEHGILPRAELARRGLAFDDVGDPEILARRASLSLDELVPFHFVPKTPFAYQVAHREGQGSLMFACVRRDRARRRGYGVIPAHAPANATARARPPDVLGWDEGFDVVDWARIDTGGDWHTDRRLRSALMAEAVSFERIPPGDVAVIFVATATAHATARCALGVASDILLIENEWMFPPDARRHVGRPGADVRG